MSIAAMDSTIVATSIPAIVRDLGGFSVYAWIFSAYVLAQAVTIPIYGKLADLYGRRPLLTVGVLIFLLGSMLCGAASNMGMLILCRALQGIGAGAIMPIVFTIVGDLYPLHERGRVQGILSSVWGACAIIGPAVGGFFSDFATWRWIFFVNSPIGLIALAIVTTTFEERVEHRQHQIDVLGSGLLALGAGAAILWLLSGGVQWPWLSAPSLFVLVVALVALVAFGWQEGRAAEPTVPPWLLRSRILIGATASSAIVGALAIGLITILPTYAQRVLGLPAMGAGFLLTACSVFWSVGSVASSRIFPRVGFRNNALVGIGVVLMASLVFAALPETPPVWALAASSATLGLGLGLISTPLLIGLQTVVSWEQRGTATGAFTFAQQIGQAIGAAIFVSLASSVLLGWFASAPPQLAAQLPTSLNDASHALAAGDTHLSGAAVRYIQEGLALATHQVFVGMIAVSLVGLLVLLVTPSGFERLDDVLDPLAGEV